jgi:hypothetical protein
MEWCALIILAVPFLLLPNQNKAQNIALEWKGEDRVSNVDTIYKNVIGELWAKLGKGKLHFFLVHNCNIEEILTKVKNL